ncbi:hypothetical protein CF319_g8456 [Tilletia indica]|nr:hypothetical protein CF319_g8456 [Tilletia indica]
MMLDRRSQPPPRIRRPTPRDQIAEQRVPERREDRPVEDEARTGDEFDDGLSANERDANMNEGGGEDENNESGDGEDDEDEDVKVGEENNEGDTSEGNNNSSWKGKAPVRGSQLLNDIEEDLIRNVSPAPPGPSRNTTTATSGKRKRPGPSKPDALEEMASFFKESSEAAEARRQRWEQEQQQRSEDTRRREDAVQARHEAEMEVRRQEAAANQNMARVIFALVEAIPSQSQPSLP